MRYSPFHRANESVVKAKLHHRFGNREGTEKRLLLPCDARKESVFSRGGGARQGETPRAASFHSEGDLVQTKGLNSVSAPMMGGGVAQRVEWEN